LGRHLSGISIFRQQANGDLASLATFRRGTFYFRGRGPGLAIYSRSGKPRNGHQSWLRGASATASIRLLV